MVASSPQVLVVDDEPRMCDALQRVLEKKGYRVATAPDGELALRLIKDKKPDVLLLDVVMPGTDGRAVCRRARELSPLTQIIYFTAKAEPIKPLKLRDLHSEADAFITKPATSKQILSKISRVLRGAQP